jgi:hypothetical protein
MSVTLKVGYWLIRRGRIAGYSGFVKSAPSSGEFANCPKKVTGHAVTRDGEAAN